MITSETQEQPDSIDETILKSKIEMLANELLHGRKTYLGVQEDLGYKIQLIASIWELVRYALDKSSWDYGSDLLAGCALYFGVGTQPHWELGIGRQAMIDALNVKARQFDLAFGRFKHLLQGHKLFEEVVRKQKEGQFSQPYFRVIPIDRESMKRLNSIEIKRFKRLYKEGWPSTEIFRRLNRDLNPTKACQAMIRYRNKCNLPKRAISAGVLKPSVRGKRLSLRTPRSIRTKQLRTRLSAVSLRKERLITMSRKWRGCIDKWEKELMRLEKERAKLQATIKARLG